jgi:hypothetical protein
VFFVADALEVLFRVRVRLGVLAQVLGGADGVAREVLEQVEEHRVFGQQVEHVCRLGREC